MSARSRLFVALLTVALIAAVGAVEAARIGEGGLLGLLIVIDVVVIGVLLSLRVSGPVMVRSDLATWLESTSSVTGETTSALANRALSAYRASMSDDEPG